MPFETSYTADFSQRDPDPSVDPMFHQRWSPRSFNKQTIPDQLLTTVIDAARWSPSCFNAQPWQILTSTEDTFDSFLALLVEGNQVWAKNASVLGFMLARKHFEHNGKPNKWAVFDCGAAWMSLTLQANKFGLYTHGMGGVLYDKIYQALAIDKEAYEIICGFAIGVIDTPDKLPDDYAEREAPLPRKALVDIWKQP